MQKNWYLRSGTQSEGPFSEPEIRARLLAGAYTAGAEVKQGNSDWRPASEVKQLFAQVYLSGWYVKTNGKTVGPFVVRKILDLHRDGQFPKGALLRQGISAHWLEISEAIAMIEQKAMVIAQIAEVGGNQETNLEPGSEPRFEPEQEPCSDGNVTAVTAHSVPKPTLGVVKPAPIPLLKPAAPKRSIATVIELTIDDVVDTNKVASSIVPLATEESEPQQQSFSDPFSSQAPALISAFEAPTTYSYTAPIPVKVRPKYKAMPPSWPAANIVWSWFWCVLIVTGISIVSRIAIALMQEFPLLILFTFINLIVLLVLCSATFLWQLVISFEESATEGLLNLLVPFYSLYYMISRWDRCWKPALINAALLLSLTTLIGCLAPILVPLAAVTIVVVVKYPELRGR